MSVEGFDELQKTLGEAEHAVASLPGQIASLAVDTRHPELAIAEMERIVDAIFAPHRGNALVQQASELLKAHFKRGILQKVEDAKKSANAAKDYTRQPVGAKLDKGEIQVCPSCGRRGLRTETNGVAFYTHRYGMIPRENGNAELIDDTCHAPQESPESAEPK